MPASARDWTGNGQAVLATLNASSHAHEPRAAHDYYATPRQAVEALLRVEPFDRVWEPACGAGHISAVLKDWRIHHRSSDLIDRGYGEREDFLASIYAHCGDILTNPPFSLSTEFARKAIDVLQPQRKLALLLRIQFLESRKRQALFEASPPRYVYVFARNIRCARNGDFGHATGNACTYAWFVWVKGSTSEPVIRWL